MKKLILVSVGLLIIACEQFPSNPSKLDLSERVYIEHRDTEYVPAETTIEGIAATKVNVLSFEIRTENIESTALEFYGRAMLDGPPGYQEHSIHFRTDSLFLSVEGMEYTFNKLVSLEPGSTYTIVRPKFPTNEYAPFEGTQGMVREITITQVWAYDQDGEKHSIRVASIQ